MLAISSVGYLPLLDSRRPEHSRENEETNYSPGYLRKVALPTKLLHRTPEKRGTRDQRPKEGDPWAERIGCVEGRGKEVVETLWIWEGEHGSTRGFGSVGVA